VAESTGADDRLAAWLDALERRHLSDLTFAEVSRALRALSSCYVERRGRLGSGAALDGAGKRAAFALFYGPLHFLLVRHIVTALDAGVPAGHALLDLGCGTGVASAAWALSSSPPPGIVGIDRHPWALAEAEWTWRTLGLHGHARRADVSRAPYPRGRLAAIAAFTANELNPRARAELLAALRRRADADDSVLIVEPIAGAAAPWWTEWVETWASRGGRHDEWRVPVELPAIVKRLDHAAGLDHRTLTGRSIYVPPRRVPGTP
jgi:hypothetical protein